MKTYILPIMRTYQPNSQCFVYPKHNDDFGVEQDFLEYVLAHDGLIAQSADAADWHYLPVYWTRWHLNHNYGETGLSELQREVDRVMLDDRRTFTICQYDDGPLVDLGAATVFLASRRTSQGIDIPLLCSAHREPVPRRRKKYLASFVGRLSTHPVRQEMLDALKHRRDVYICDGRKGTSFFVRTMLRSRIALCPRGYGGSSFRFFEAMQLGVVPLLIGDLDTRPFKRFIDWGQCSFFTQSASSVGSILDRLKPLDLTAMGRRAAATWEALTFRKWCGFVIRELETLRWSRWPKG